MSNIDERYFPKTTRRMYSLIKDGEVIVESTDVDIAKKWLSLQKELGNEETFIVENLENKNKEGTSILY